ncbi:hypothetical protein NQ317_000934 [Molorchus minor]|uniref:Uncharacterized protein n=1 Tax=Molorchus minor TaxID=1323400 RepID=A0ABQ9JHI2_9CUCU|nr:hypothetical protein NQ317_000934 [Molorchus minor]
MPTKNGRQDKVARGFVDNTINSVLETWINPPFDAADFVGCDNDGQVEDDAILMAIQSWFAIRLMRQRTVSNSAERGVALVQVLN